MSFFGRAEEMARIESLLRSGARLITIVGPGGAGKTRLARRMSDAPLIDLSQIPSIAALAPQRAILDGFEHLIAEAPVLEGWPAPLLVTSREPLHLSDEEVVEIAGLDGEAAMEMFLSRSRGEPNEVRRLLEQLDHLPLAIELAAARSAVLSISEILARLDEGTGFLKNLQRGAPERHSSLDASLDWSWNLLSLEEQRAFAQLSAFVGPFSASAAEAVVSIEGSVLDVVQSLREKSLLADGLRLPATSAIFAREKLRASGEQARVYRRHAEHFLRAGGGRDELLAIVGRFRASDPATTVRSVMRLEMFTRGPFDVRVELLREATEAADRSDDASLRAEAGRALAEALRVEGQLADAVTTAERALEQARRSGSTTIEAAALRELGICLRESDRPREALARLNEALELARAAGDRAHEGVLLGGIGTLHRLTGVLDEAESFYEAALAIHLRVNDRRFQAIDLGNLGHLDLERGFLEDAEVRYRAALELIREVGDKRSTGILLGFLGHVRFELGHLDDALAGYTEAMAALSEVGDPDMLALFTAYRDAALAFASPGGPRAAPTTTNVYVSRALEVLAGFRELERAYELSSSRDDRGAEKLLARIQHRLDTAASPYLMPAVRILRLALQSFPANPFDQAAGGDRLLQVARDGRWFQWPGEDPISLTRRKALRRLMERLAEARRTKPGRPVPATELIRAAWPHEEILEKAATARLYVAISSLRKLGLRDAIRARDEGYLLVPHATIVLEPSDADG